MSFGLAASLSQASTDAAKSTGTSWLSGLWSDVKETGLEILKDVGTTTVGKWVNEKLLGLEGGGSKPAEKPTPQPQAPAVDEQVRNNPAAVGATNAAAGGGFNLGGSGGILLLVGALLFLGKR